MSEPQRIIHGAGDDIEAALLRSAQHDGPDRQSMRRALAASRPAMTLRVACTRRCRSAVAAGACGSLHPVRPNTINTRPNAP